MICSCPEPDFMAPLRVNVFAYSFFAGFQLPSRLRVNIFV